MRPNRPFLKALSAALLLSLSPFVRAADFYVDAENGDDNGDGSEGNPWRSLQQVLDDGLVESLEPEAFPFDGTGTLIDKNAGAPVRAGDTIWLLDGDFGFLTIESFYNEDWITVRAAANAEPRFSGILVRGSSMWRLSGLLVSAEYEVPYRRHTLVDLDSHAFRGPVHEIAVDNCTISSLTDASKWSDVDWDTLSCNGIQADGGFHVIRYNKIKNVNFGISVGASDTLVEGNTIDGFAGDGMRGLGDNSVFQYNTVKNCYDVNDNHDDGFQSWSAGEDGEVGNGEVTGIVLRGNTIINYEDPNQPYRGTLQGIGCFDGTFVGWVVENNIIMTDHWHGITLLGARGCRIVNNTVMDLNDEDPGPPWISIGDHKDGTPPKDCIVRNNLTTDLANDTGVTEDNNLIINDADTLFVDAAHFDVHLLSTATDAIDRGSSDLAPALDADKIKRPQGDGIDLGAFELHDDDVQPEPDDTDENETDTHIGAVGDNSGALAPMPDSEDSGCACRTTGPQRFSTIAFLRAIFESCPYIPK